MQCPTRAHAARGGCGEAVQGDAEVGDETELGADRGHVRLLILEDRQVVLADDDEVAVVDGGW